MPVTLQTIAKKCGIDVSTVSRALRGDNRVKPETRELIKSVADGLGYKPNLAARSLQSGKTNTAWFVIPSLTNVFERAMAEPASRFFVQKKYDMLVALSHHDHQAYVRILDRLSQGGADAALLVAEHSMDSVTFQNLVKAKFPMVFLDRYIEGLPVPVVTNANFNSAEMLVDKCVECDSEEFVLLIPDTDTACRERLKGAISKLEERNKAYHIVPTAGIEQFHLTLNHSRVAVIGNGPELIRAFVNSKYEQLKDKALVAATYDHWQGEIAPAESVFVCVQNFHDMAEAAVEKLFKILNAKKYKPQFEKIEIAPLEILTYNR